MCGTVGEGGVSEKGKEGMVEEASRSISCLRRLHTTQ